MSLPCSSGWGSDAMSWSIEFLPFVPWPVLWSLAGLGVVLLALLFWRSRRGAIFRLLSYALLLLAIANPQLKQEDREPLNDVLAVVVDDSQSQAIAGRTARTAELRKELEERLKSFPNLDVRWVNSTSTSADSERDGTMLFTDLAQALADVPPDRLAGVIMITDGEVHDVPASAAGLGFDAPVHALLTGKPGEFDRRLQVLSAPRFGIVGSSQNIEVKVTDTTTAPGAAGPVKLTVTHQGQPPVMQSVQLGEKVEIPVNIDHAGPNIVEIEAEPAKGELTTVNNRAVLTVEGVRENLRVLLVSGEPHAGERTWRNMLKSDASVDLVHFTILRPPEKQDGTPINQLSLIAFPTRELFQEKLDQFDLIIFDRYQRRGVLPLLYLENVARYVEKGGAVLVSAGDDYASPLSLYRSPLGQILPAVPSGRVVEEPFKPRLTELGEKHPVTSDLPGSSGPEPSWGHWFRVVDVSPRDAEVLMKGAQDKPLLIIGQRGEGRVGMLLVRSRLALGARLRRRRTLYRSAAPARPLADEGARPRGRDAESDEPRPDALHRAPLDQGRGRARHRDRALGQGRDRHPRQGRARPVAQGHDRERARRLPHLLGQTRERRHRRQRQCARARRRHRDRRGAHAHSRRDRRRQLLARPDRRGWRRNCRAW